MKSFLFFASGLFIGTGATVLYFRKRFNEEIERIEKQYEDIIEAAYGEDVDKDIDAKDDKNEEEVDEKFTKTSISKDNRNKDNDTNYKTFYKPSLKNLTDLRDSLNKKNDEDLSDHMAVRESPEEDDGYAEVSTEELDEMNINDNDIVDICVYEDDIFTYLDTDEIVTDPMESLIGDRFTNRILNRDKDDESIWYSAIYILNEKVNTVFAIQFIPNEYHHI